MLRAVVFTRYRRVTDRQTDGIAVASTALAKRRAVKSYTRQITKQVPCSYCYVVARSDDVAKDPIEI